MALGQTQSLSLKLGQKLVMTQSMQQAIKLLQMTRLDLVNEVQQELLENPLLEDLSQTPEMEGPAESSTEESTPDPEPIDTSSSEQDSPEPQAEQADAFENIDLDDYFGDYLGEPYPQYERGTYDFSEQPPFENMVAAQETLYSVLERQLGLLSLSPEEYDVGIEIIGNIDDDGWLRSVELEEIALQMNIDLETVEKIWNIIREFDPLGVGGRNIHEILEIQIAYSEWAGTEIEELLLEHYHLLEKQKYREIMSILKVDADTLKRYLKIIKKFDPKPGLKYASGPVRYVVPDVTIKKVEDDYEIELAYEGTPPLAISQVYKKLMEQTKNGDKDVNSYLQEKLRSAMWLIKSLDQRNRTIYKVTEALLRHQRDFFDRGIEYMKPLVLREIADDIGMHESTVSRVVNGKYVRTPRGIFELCEFFNSGISCVFGEEVSSIAVKEKTRKLIQNEPPEKPLSDDAIRLALEREGILIARRTIAKYREELNIPSSSKRKQKL